MPQLDSDSFPYADGDLETVSSGKWTKLSGSTSAVQVTANQITGSNNEAGQLITSWAGSPTLQYAEMTYVSGLYGGPIIFASQPYTFYLADLSTNVGLFKVVGGAYSLLAGTGTPPLAGHVYRISMDTAGTLIVFDNGIAIITVTGEFSITSGVPGLRNWSAVLADWAAGDFSLVITTDPIGSTATVTAPAIAYEVNGATLSAATSLSAPTVAAASETAVDGATIAATTTLFPPRAAVVVTDLIVGGGAGFPHPIPRPPARHLQVDGGLELDLHVSGRVTVHLTRMRETHGTGAGVLTVDARTVRTLAVVQRAVSTVIDVGIIVSGTPQLHRHLRQVGSRGAIGLQPIVTATVERDAPRVHVHSAATVTLTGTLGRRLAPQAATDDDEDLLRDLLGMTG